MLGRARGWVRSLAREPLAPGFRRGDERGDQRLEARLPVVEEVLVGEYLAANRFAACVRWCARGGGDRNFPRSGRHPAEDPEGSSVRRGGSAPPSNPKRAMSKRAVRSRVGESGSRRRGGLDGKPTGEQSVLVKMIQVSSHQS